MRTTSMVRRLAKNDVVFAPAAVEEIDLIIDHYEELHAVSEMLNALSEGGPLVLSDHSM